MGTMKRTADALEQIAQHLEVLIWKFERIAVALEPSKPKPTTKDERDKEIIERRKSGETVLSVAKDVGIGTTRVAQISREGGVVKKRAGFSRITHDGYISCQSLKRYGAKEGSASEFCKRKGIRLYTFKNHKYFEEKYLDIVLRG